MSTGCEGARAALAECRRLTEEAELTRWWEVSRRRELYASAEAARQRAREHLDGMESGQ